MTAKYLPTVCAVFEVYWMDGEREACTRMDASVLPPVDLDEIERIAAAAHPTMHRWQLVVVYDELAAA
jgi:hypothetical protein